MHLVAGTTLKNGQYLLNHVLDQQGVGWTYRATNNQLQQTVIVKTLNPTLRSHPQFSAICQDFIDRSSTLETLHHPSLVQVLDIFVDQQEMPFVVLEYLQGVSLNDRINDRTHTEAEVIDFLRKMTHVLTYLQQHELPHANLKPHNILYSIDPQQPETHTLKLIGFAPSLRLGEMISKRNPYSAPELLQGKVTPQSDIYSLSCLLYYCLTQHPPAESITESERFPLLTLLKPGAQRLLRSASQFNPTDRPDNAEIWLSQLSKTRPASPIESLPQTKQLQTQLQTQTQNQLPDPKATHIQELSSQPIAPIESSQKPTYIQAPTRLPTAPNFPQTQVQPTTTQVQPPRDPNTPPVRPQPIAPMVQNHPTVAEFPPPYLTSPIMPLPTESPQLSENLSQRRIPQSTPPRYIPNQPSKNQPILTPPRQALLKTSRRSSNTLPSLKVLQIVALGSVFLGLVFGVVLRYQASQRPGASFFHTDQSFPPREWKGSTATAPAASQEVFINPTTRTETSPISNNKPQSEPNSKTNFPTRSQPFNPADAMVKDPTESTSPQPSNNIATPEATPTEDRSTEGAATEGTPAKANRTAGTATETPNLKIDRPPVTDNSPAPDTSPPSDANPTFDPIKPNKLP